MNLSTLLEREMSQPRVGLGAQSQLAVKLFLMASHGKDFEFVSMAGESSSDPDLVANIKGQRVQFEIKGRNTPNATVKLYERRIGRGERDPLFDAFARSYSNGEANNFTEMVDMVRVADPTVGFPGDEGVVAKAGKFYIPAEDAKTRTLMRRYIIDTLKTNSDDYFAIQTRQPAKVEIYDIGSSSVIDAPKLPNIKTVRLETYGGAYKNKMRMAIKVIFAR